MSEPTRGQLQQVYQLIKTGQNQEAIDILRPILTVDPNNADAWWLMANAATEPAEQRAALNRVLLLRPDHKQAQEKLNALETAQEFRFDEPEKPKRDFPSSSPLIVQPAKSGTNPILIILAVVGLIALLVCGACFVIATQGATLFGQVIATLAESVTTLPGGSFPQDLSDISNLDQNGGINRGDSLQGQVNSPFDEEGYTFVGETGQTISISVETSDSDFLPQVALYDPSGALVESDSAFSFDSSLDAQITTRLPSSGTYTIVVSGFVSEGRFTLRVE